MKKLSLALLVCLSASAFAAQKSKPKADTTAKNAVLATQMAQAIFDNCVTHEAEAALVDKDLVMKSALPNLCKVMENREAAMRGSPIAAAGQADMDALNVSHAECIYRTLGGRMVNSARILYSGDLDEVMNRVQNLVDASRQELPACDPAMCGDSGQAESLRKSCAAFVNADSFRRMVDRFRTASYFGDTKNIAQEQAETAMKSILEEATGDMLMVRGYLKVSR